jgi:hypothetical protein
MYLEAISAYLIILLLTVRFEWEILGSVQTRERSRFPFCSWSRWVLSFVALGTESIGRVVNAVIWHCNIVNLQEYAGICRSIILCSAFLVIKVVAGTEVLTAVVMKSNIFRRTTPCSLCCACHLLSRWYIARVRPWRWRRYVPSKRRLTQRTTGRCIPEDSSTLQSSCSSYKRKACYHCTTWISVILCINIVT